MSKRKRKKIIIFCLYFLLVFIVFSVTIKDKNGQTLYNNIFENKKIDLETSDDESNVSKKQSTIEVKQNDNIKNPNKESKKNTTTQKANNKEINNNNKNTTTQKANNKEINNNNKNTTNVSTSNNTTNDIKKVVKEITPTKVYKCTGEYKLNGDKCEYSFTSEASIYYSCDDGQLVGSECQYNRREDISNKMIDYSYCREQYGNTNEYYVKRCLCSANGGQMDINSRCVKLVTKKVKANATYKCPDGFTLNGSKCEKKYSTAALFDYTCPDGYELIGNMCKEK